MTASDPISPTPATVGCYDVDIAIDAPPARVWEALTREIDRWWLADFRLVGEGSEVSLDLAPGGHLAERKGDGCLLWYTVAAVKPGESLDLIGHMGRGWGGPTLSTLTLRLAASATGTTFTIQDGLCGQVTAKQIESLRTGWTQLFTDGLKSWVESK